MTSACHIPPIPLLADNSVQMFHAGLAAAGPLWGFLGCGAGRRKLSAFLRGYLRRKNGMPTPAFQPGPEFCGEVAHEQ